MCIYLFFFLSFFFFSPFSFPVDVTTKHPNLFTTKYMGQTISTEGIIFSSSSSSLHFLLQMCRWLDAAYAFAFANMLILMLWCVYLCRCFFLNRECHQRADAVASSLALAATARAVIAGGLAAAAEVQAEAAGALEVLCLCVHVCMCVYMCVHVCLVVVV